MDRGWKGSLLVWVLQQLEQTSPHEKVISSVDNILCCALILSYTFLLRKLFLVHWREYWAGTLRGVDLSHYCTYSQFLWDSWTR